MALTGIVFLVVFVACIVLALVRDPRIGLYTYLAMFYLHPPSRWWGAFLPDLRWALIAAVATLLATLRLPARKDAPGWTSNAPARLLIVFTLWLWVQNAWALAPEEHLEVSILFTKYLVLFYLIYRLLDTPAQVGNFLFAHVLGCGLLGWLALIAPDYGRLEGVGGPGIDEANALGMFVSTGGLCAGMLVLGERSWKRWICLMLLPLIGNTIVQSESRGAMLGLVTGAVIVFYLGARTDRWRMLVLGLAGLIAFAVIAPPVYLERMLTLRAAVEQSEDIDSSAESRIWLAKAQLDMASRNLLGHGHRGTAVLSPQYLERRWLTKGADEDPYGVGARSSHNTLLSALVEQGVPGLVMFVWLIAWTGLMILRVRRLRLRDPEDRDRIALYGACAAGSLAIVFVAGMFTDYLKTEVQIWMFAVLVVLLRVHAPEARDARLGGPVRPAGSGPRAVSLGPGRVVPQRDVGRERSAAEGPAARRSNSPASSDVRASRE
jgi:O-antigen ligase